MTVFLDKTPSPHLRVNFLEPMREDRVFEVGRSGNVKSVVGFLMGKTGSTEQQNCFIEGARVETAVYSSLLLGSANRTPRRGITKIPTNHIGFSYKKCMITLERRLFAEWSFLDVHSCPTVDGGLFRCPCLWTRVRLGCGFFCTEK